MRTTSRILGALGLGLALLACRGAPPTPEVPLVPETTVTALAAENARLATAVATLTALAEERARFETVTANLATPTPTPEAHDPGGQAATATPQPSDTETPAPETPTAVSTPPAEETTSVYVSTTYGASLRHPAGWAPLTGYEGRYGGDDGFFQLGAISGASLSLEEVCALEHGHMLQPYGSEPSVQMLRVSDREACMVRPSADQAPEMERQAVLLVAYTEPRPIGGESYQYLVLWADTDHILQIAASLELLD